MTALRFFYSWPMWLSNLWLSNLPIQDLMKRQSAGAAVAQKLRIY